MEPLADRHAANQLAQDRPVVRRDDLKQRIAGDVVVGIAGHGDGGAGRIGDRAVLVGLEQNVGGAERQRHEPIALALQGFDLGVLFLRRRRGFVHVGSAPVYPVAGS